MVQFPQHHLNAFESLNALVLFPPKQSHETFICYSPFPHHLPRFSPIQKTPKKTLYTEFIVLMSWGWGVTEKREKVIFLPIKFLQNLGIFLCRCRFLLYVVDVEICPNFCCRTQIFFKKVVESTKGLPPFVRSLVPDLPVG